MPGSRGFGRRDERRVGYPRREGAPRLLASPPCIHWCGLGCRSEVRNYARDSQTEWETTDTIKCRNHLGEEIWQRRFYDFNLWTERKRIEKLRYMHRNPVKRGLVSQPEHWAWSSFRAYAFGEPVAVRINDCQVLKMKVRPSRLQRRASTPTLSPKTRKGRAPPPDSLCCGQKGWATAHVAREALTNRLFYGTRPNNGRWPSRLRRRGQTWHPASTRVLCVVHIAV